jgi:ABC-type phosphate/phosphonate transport system substrate-binding protein
MSGSLVACSQDPPDVRIGIVRTLFRGMSETLVDALLHPFSMLMESQTGLKGELVPVTDALQLGKAIAENRVQLGVFQGIEFAWAKQKHPDLVPLMVACNQDNYLQAYLVVARNHRVGELTDLRGKTIGIPSRSRLHCHLFLERLCQDAGAQSSKQFFAQIETPSNCEDALDDLVDGKVAAVVLEKVGFDCYTRRKPARESQLRILSRSEVFPASVVAYREGTIDRATLRQFRDGLVNARNLALGRQLMTMWKITSFEPAPASYDQMVRDIARAYPHTGKLPSTIDQGLSQPDQVSTMRR